MRLSHLAMVDFRNYTAAQWHPSQGANVLLGPNGAGKTNILEAIHLVVTGSSSRAVREREMARWGCSAFAVRAQVIRDEYPDPLDCHVVWTQQQGKSLRRGGKALTGAGRSGVLGGAVLFSPDDLEIVKGSPSRRREYLDLAVAKALPRYRGLLRRYSTALAHRNRLLGEAAGRRDRRQVLPELQPWTQQLVTIGAEVLRHRMWALFHLAPPACAAYARLGGRDEPLTLHYLPASDGGTSVDQQGPTAEVPPSYEGPGWEPNRERTDEEMSRYLAESFATRQREELARGLTLVGPHRDDLLVSVGGAPVRVFGSQGQQRSAALALRLAENAFLRDALQDTPLLLLDDVFSELDARRREGLLSLLREAGQGHQTFLTGTDLAGVPVEGFEPLAVFDVVGGAVIPSQRR